LPPVPLPEGEDRKRRVAPAGISSKNRTRWVKARGGRIAPLHLLLPVLSLAFRNHFSFSHPTASSRRLNPYGSLMPVGADPENLVNWRQFLGVTLPLCATAVDEIVHNLASFCFLSRAIFSKIR